MLFVHTFNKSRGADLLPLIAKRIKDNNLGTVLRKMKRIKYDNLGRVIKNSENYKGKKFSTIGNEKKNNPRLKVKSANQYAEIMRNLKLDNPTMIDIAIPANIKGKTLDQTD